jgi:RHS repeat-associated protein
MSALTVSGSPPNPVYFSYYNSGGSEVTLTVKYTSETIRTNFGCSGITDYGPTAQNLVSEIDLPDSTKYTFTYEETTPGSTQYYTGRLAQVTLPTGGTITYVYNGPNNGITCADGSAATLSRTLNPGGAWSYTHTESGSTWTTDITAPADPQGNQAYTTISFQGIYETQRKVYSANGGTLWATVATCYNGAPIPCTGTVVSLPISNRTAQVTFPNLSASSTYTMYNSYGLPTEVEEYGYGGALVRTTLATYATPGSYYYWYDRPSEIQIEDSGGTLRAQSNYTYDTYGNRLSETATNTGYSPASISCAFTYSSSGVLQTSKDFNGNTTTYTNTGCSSSFPTTITLPNSLSTSASWNCYLGQPNSTTDVNGETTVFSYDNMLRLTEIAYPDQGQANIEYTDTQGAFSVATSRLVSSALGNHTVTQYLDGLGRVEKSVDSQACNQASSSVATAYDSLGRVYTVSNPYCTTSDPTYGLTTYGYDALNRVISVEAPDGSPTYTTYPANCATTKDPALKQRTLCSDALGRITSVTEDPSGLNYQTTYSYDSLNNLKGVSQSGQTRTYNYDMLSRLTSSEVPEVNIGGTQCSTTYGYDANGNLTSKAAPRANQNLRCTTTTTTYAYDALNRLTSKTYSDGTPTATFSYDQTSVTIGSWSSGTLYYPKGRITEATTTSSGSVNTGVVYSYDPVGRTKDFWQCNPSNCGSSSIWDTHYNYDLAGDIQSWVHPAGYTLTNTVNSAQQITAVQSSWQDSSHPQYLAQSISYTPWGAVSQLENGCVPSGCTPALETYTYNNRLQAAQIQLSGSPSGGYTLAYNYYLPGTTPTGCPVAAAGTGNNGNVIGYTYTDAVNNKAMSHSALYVYDTLNRLVCAQATSPNNNPTATYDLVFSYDRYGNMACVQNANTNGPCPQWAYNPSTNQLTTSGFTYDAAGNLTKDSSNLTAHTYQWDAEGRVSAVDPGTSPTWSFTYNAVGDRVQWAYGSSGGADQHLFDPAGGWLGNAGEYSVVRWGAGYLVVYTSSETYFNHINNISSTSMLTNHAGTTVEDMLFYPWGDVWQSWGSGGYNFSGMPYRDGTTMTDITTARFSSPNLGRWLSPDPAGLGAVDPSNPQSWNRYAFVLNDPPTLAGQGDANLQADSNGVGVSDSGAAIIVPNISSGANQMSSALASGTNLCRGCTGAPSGKPGQNGLGTPPISGFSTALMGFLGVPLFYLPSPAIDQSEQAALDQIAQAIMNGKASAAPVYPAQTFPPPPLDIGDDPWNTAYYNFLELFAKINPSTILVEESAACYEGNPAACGDTTDAAAFQGLMNGPWGGGSEAMGWGIPSYPGCWWVGRICRPTI